MNKGKIIYSGNDDTYIRDTYSNWTTVLLTIMSNIKTNNNIVLEEPFKSKYDYFVDFKTITKVLQNDKYFILVGTERHTGIEKEAYVPEFVYTELNIEVFDRNTKDFCKKLYKNNIEDELSNIDLCDPALSQRINELKRALRKINKLVY